MKRNTVVGLKIRKPSGPTPPNRSTGIRNGIRVLDASNAPFNKWFSGGMLNTCYNVLDVHVENGRANQIAIIYDSPVTGVIKSFTYSELLD